VTTLAKPVHNLPVYALIGQKIHAASAIGYTTSARNASAAKARDVNIRYLGNCQKYPASWQDAWRAGSL
jgi:hypothetical protein